jgi:Flp pilus assembly pilin Flp
MRKLIQRLHRDEGGAELIEYILIMAAIGLPLLGLVIWFRNDIWEWVQSLYEDTKSDSQSTPGL